MTGHTGFKGSWLTLWLQQLGANVSGLALPPETDPCHWKLLGLDICEKIVDIRDNIAVSNWVKQVKPEIVFHLAAQPLVRRSYNNPLESWSTNVTGTAALLDACRNCEDVRAVVVVTTDKVYQNNEWPWGYREIDRLGGHDPYSASKAAAELVVASFRSSYFHLPGSPLLATARAGNVIGGGDWSEDRLIPDLVHAVKSGQSLEIRSPHATRPWQHVLECLSGYLMLGQCLLEGKSEFTDAWNFGPEPDSNREVAGVLAELCKLWPQVTWHQTNDQHPHEANLLYLDSTKSKRSLGWRPVWNLSETLAATSDWYQSYLYDKEIATVRQLEVFTQAALQQNLPWIK